VCYRLYSKHDLHGMLPFIQPEILASDLTRLVLELAVWGVKDPRTLSWLDAPPSAGWDSGLRLLRDLGALDPSGSVTSAGRAMARFRFAETSRLMLRAGNWAVYALARILPQFSRSGICSAPCNGISHR
jgi:ATP-dependent helicase HrpB